MFKFDCRQVTGVIETLHVSSTEQGTVTAYIVIDGQVLPKVLLPGKIYEELGKGQRVTLYGFFTKKKDKMQNQATIYAMKGENGLLIAAKELQFKVPILIMVSAIPLMILTFVIGCFASPYLIYLVTGSEDPDYLVPNTFIWAFWEGIAAGVFMLGCAINFIRKSNDPEGWAPIGIAELSQRFSKAFK
ncbi:hypothetical protein AA098_03340 [Pseudomonas sp. JY-Q]|uniref:Uncharacterized protein n=1 Tax=Pseudomonas putida (strain GB-1) TaxID=76869 RepID=B0KJ03_PSEPG|nr:hypothetical protein PputGB1_4806 [Pseudomonas putida GB-1]ANI32587.1 hypothetical protein AA098_03340 [Pseudomonas sp. JY-Q]